MQVFKNIFGFDVVRAINEERRDLTPEALGLLYKAVAQDLLTYFPEQAKWAQFLIHEMFQDRQNLMMRQKDVLFHQTASNSREILTVYCMDIHRHESLFQLKMMYLSGVIRCHFPEKENAENVLPYLNSINVFLTELGRHLQVLQIAGKTNDFKSIMGGLHGCFQGRGATDLRYPHVCFALLLVDEKSREIATNAVLFMENHPGEKIENLQIFQSMVTKWYQEIKSQEGRCC